jgi:hypothetical protein
LSNINEDWDKWLRKEKKYMESLKIPSSDEFYKNLIKKIEHEVYKLKDE